MRSLLFLLLASVAVVGCAKPLPTPPDVDAEYRALLESLDGELPGRSVRRLTTFTYKYDEFDIVPEVEAEIDRISEMAQGGYREARDLARAMDFDDAEEILVDLATYLPNTRDGKDAKEHLAFDFYYGKSQTLLVDQRWEEAADAVRPLLDQDLTRAQERQVQATLDAVSTTGTAYSNATRAQAMADTRLVVMYLQLTYSEWGEYPRTLTLADVAEWDPVGSRSLLRNVSAIEDYTFTDTSYSFTAVTVQGQQRIRVVDGMIER